MSGRRRARQPTITVDTTAVGPPEIIDPDILMQPMSDPTSPQESAPEPSLLSPSSAGNFLSVPHLLSPSSSSLGGDTFAPSIAPSSNSRQSMSGVESTNGTLINDQDALKPDPGTEQDFTVENNPFAFTPGQLAKMYNPKSLSAFYALGGLAGLAKGLRTNLETGLDVDEARLEGNVPFEQVTTTPPSSEPSSGVGDGYENPIRNSFMGDGSLTPWCSDAADAKAASPLSKQADGAFADRRRVFKDNRLPERKSKSIFELMWITYNDKVLILLSIAAVVSLAIGVYQSVEASRNKTGEAPIEWVEGVAIMVAIIIVVIVGSINDWQKERQFVKLNKKKDDRYIKVVRSGKTTEISVYDVLAGDVVLLEPGDVIPVDGVFIGGHNLKSDESSATGESDVLKKTPADDVYAAIKNHDNLKKLDPFILSGGKVSEGVGRFLVTATGVNSSFGKTMMALRDEGEVTPLQAKLNVLAESIAKLGGAAALLYFVVAFIEFLVRITQGAEATLPAAQKGQIFLNIFIIAVSIIVVAVPEGLPLAVTLALAFATTRMLKDNNLVRLLRSCETMGNATTVCSDKTGTLTQNVMTVVAGTFGTSSRFGDRKGLKAAPERSPSRQDDVFPRELIKTFGPDVQDLLSQSISINSTAFEGTIDGKETFIGSKTETAMLVFARTYLGMGPVAVERSNANITYVIPFDSSRKCMATVVSRPNGGHRMYVKGASEILLARCTGIIEDPCRDATSRDISEENTKTLNDIISSYASRSLRTIGICYKDFEAWPPKGVRQDEKDPSQLRVEDLLKDMTFFGVVGIQDPLRDGVTKAVADCVRAGVFVRMVTGDNVETAKAIAAECGIYTSGGLVMEGPEFRKLPSREMERVLPRLQVLARSSPEDKRVLVKRLKAMGETVAVTGDGTNDAPALKTADVGFSMGITGTEVAKEASAIILMDDNFASIVKALMWGRAVNDAVRKFLQFQITVNITAVFITFVTGVASDDGNSVLTAVQLLWVNLIMDTFAALALATDPPSESCLDRKPDRKDARLISTTMWKMIIGQAIYQIVVTFVLYFRGCSILRYSPDQCTSGRSDLVTLIFNSFVWMQIFNAFNNRRLDNKFNILEGIQRNWFFIGIISIMIGGQILIIFVGGAAISVVSPPLDGVQWAISIVLGALTVPIGAAIRLIPDEFAALLVPSYIKRHTAPKQPAREEEERRVVFNPALEEVRDQLLWLKKFKGGRLNTLKFQIQHPREAGLLPRPSTHRSRSSTAASATESDPAFPRHSRSRSSSKLGPALVSAGVIGGSIGGWSPVERTDRSERRPST